ncbi:hypothetical protein KKG19_04765 [Patescibacteria group bacterium]|nr:hypothetical protein [Nanoarchaeota archaeon]MBU1706005.1 hypothetical protein [Patescibacteria group bacterium]
MGERFSELKRLNNSLINMNKCLSLQLDLKLDECKFEKIRNSVLSKPYSKKIQLKDQTRFTRIIENMWINEIYLKQSIIQNKDIWEIPLKSIDGEEKNSSMVMIRGNNHFFYMDYVAFYYSIFNSISLLTVLFHQDGKLKQHEGKIHKFNIRICEMEYIKNILPKPFSIVICNDYCYINNQNNKVNSNFHKLLDSYIKINEKNEKQKTLSGENLITECENSLRFCRSLTKAYLKNTRKKSFSFIDYLLSFRHYFHYNCSVTLDHSEYDFDRLIHEIRENCYSLLVIFNYYIELLFYNFTKYELKEIFDKFKKKLDLKSHGVKEELTSEINYRIKLI